MLRHFGKPVGSCQSINKDGTLLKVLQIKVYPEKKDLLHNHNRLQQILAQAEKSCNPDVVITPECFLDGYAASDSLVRKEDMEQLAIDPYNSEFTKAVSIWVEKNSCWFIYGCSRKTLEGVYNSAVIFNRQGQIVGIYDKLHLQDHDLKCIPGQSLGVFESDFGKFGVMICADRRWPETTRSLTLKGAKIIFNPTYGMSCDLNLAMMRTRSFENGIFIAFTHPRQSLITGPAGNVVTNQENDGDEFTLTEIDLSLATGKENNHILDRRVDLYEMS